MSRIPLPRRVVELPTDQFLALTRVAGESSVPRGTRTLGEDYVQVRGQSGSFQLGTPAPGEPTYRPDESLFIRREKFLGVDYSTLEARVIAMGLHEGMAEEKALRKKEGLPGLPAVRRMMASGPMITGDGAVRQPQHGADWYADGRPENPGHWIDPDVGHHHRGLSPLGQLRSAEFFAKAYKEEMARQESAGEGRVTFTKATDTSRADGESKADVRARIKAAVNALPPQWNFEFSDFNVQGTTTGRLPSAVAAEGNVPRGTKATGSRVFFHLNDTKGEPVRDAYEVMNNPDLDKVKFLIRNGVLYALRGIATAGDITRVEFEQVAPETVLNWWN